MDISTESMSKMFLADSVETAVCPPPPLLVSCSSWYFIIPLWHLMRVVYRLALEQGLEKKMSEPVRGGRRFFLKGPKKKDPSKNENEQYVKNNNNLITFQRI